jgi:hypothetical protein
MVVGANLTLMVQDPAEITAAHVPPVPGKLPPTNENPEGNVAEGLVMVVT